MKQRLKTEEEGGVTETRVRIKFQRRKAQHSLKWGWGT